MRTVKDNMRYGVSLIDTEKVSTAYRARGFLGETLTFDGHEMLEALAEDLGYTLHKKVRTLEHEGETFWHSDDVKPCREDAEHETRSHLAPQVVVPSPETSSGFAFIGYHGVRGWWRPYYMDQVPHALKNGE